jgi:DNA replication protein DnaC
MLPRRTRTFDLLVLNQIPIEHLHETIGNHIIADAILDRLVHNAHKQTLKGDFMRKSYWPAANSKRRCQR